MKAIQTLTLSCSLLALAGQSIAAPPKFSMLPGGFKSVGGVKMSPGLFKKFQPNPSSSKTLKLANPGLLGGPHQATMIPPEMLGKLKKSTPPSGSTPPSKSPQGQPPWWGPLANPGFWIGQLHQSHPGGGWSSGPSYYPDDPEPMPVDPGWGYGDAQPAPEPLPDNSLDPPVVLINTAENRTVIHCRVNGQLLALEPGQEISFPAGQKWTIEFHRGGNFGRARYSMRTGPHRFARTSHGWELYQGLPKSGQQQGQMDQDDLPANSW